MLRAGNNDYGFQSRFPGIGTGPVRDGIGA